MNIALLGHGVVGSGVTSVLKEEKIKDLIVSRILVARKESIKDERFTLDFEEIVNDENIRVIVECMGGIEPAYSFVRRAIEAGKHVISANKKMLANHMELFELANSKGVKLLAEASCGGGIPCISNLQRIARNDHILSFEGILNGTSNFILSTIFEKGHSFKETLKTAQELGYAERDPSDDIKGYDVRYKSVILSYFAFSKIIDPKNVFTFGIDTLSNEDIAYARERHKVIKLIAKAGYEDEKFYVYVMPHFVDERSIFGNVDSNYNILQIQSGYLGKASFIGQGAGSYPTGHSIVQDLLDLNEKKYTEEKRASKETVENGKEGIFYVRCKDQCFDELKDITITADSFLTKKCPISKIQECMKESEDETMFIGEMGI